MMDKLTYIKNHYQEKDDRQLANNLNCSPDAVKEVRLDNNIYRRHRYPWTPTELKELDRIYANASWDQLKWEFERSRHSIYKKANRKGLSRSEDKIKEGAARAGRKSSKPKPQVKIVL